MPQFLGQHASGLAMIGRGLDVLEPIFQRFLLRDFQHRPGEAGRQAFWDWQAHNWAASSTLRALLMATWRSWCSGAAEKPCKAATCSRRASSRGHNSIGRAGFGRVGRVGGQIAERGGRQNLGRRRFGPQAGHQRPMPIDLVPPDLHRREKKAIAEMSAFAQRRRGALQRLAIGTRAVQQETEIVRPNLGVAGHRFAVQPYVVGGRAEQHVRHAVFAVGDAQFILVPVDFGPAVRAAIRVSQRQPVRIRLGMVGMGLVHPARLRHAHTVGLLVPWEHVQQGNLHGQGQLFAQADVRRRTPEHQAARERKQMKLAGEIGPANRRRQAAEGSEREQVSHAAQPSLVGQQIRLRPGGQLILLRVGQARVAQARQNAEPGLVQVVQSIGRLAIGDAQQPAEEAQTLPRPAFRSPGP